MTKLKRTFFLGRDIRYQQFFSAAKRWSTNLKQKAGCSIFTSSFPIRLAGSGKDVEIRKLASNINSPA